jgi:hypothetical protein
LFESLKPPLAGLIPAHTQKKTGHRQRRAALLPTTKCRPSPVFNGSNNTSPLTFSLGPRSSRQEKTIMGAKSDVGFPFDRRRRFSEKQISTA